MHQGTVVDVTKFGAFVKLPSGKTGLVHISQISDKYVKEVSDHVAPGDTILVKVMSLDDKGRIQLSIKAVTPAETAQFAQTGAVAAPSGDASEPGAPDASRPDALPNYPSAHTERRHGGGHHHDGEDTFEKKMRFFMRQSEDRLVDVRRNLDSKRGIKKKKKH